MGKKERGEGGGARIIEEQSLRNMYFIESRTNNIIVIYLLYVTHI